jgi:hypothetical protein
MKYTVNGFDVCTPGFEELRLQSEFLLVASIDSETTAEQLLEDFLSDIQVCERPDNFDYQAVRTCVSEYFESVLNNRFAKPNPFHLEPGSEDNGCNAYLYILETEE